MVVVNVGGQVNRRFAREHVENALDAVRGGGSCNQQDGVGLVSLEPRNNGVGFANGRGIVVSCDKDGVAVKTAEAHEVFEVEFGVAPVAENAAPQNEYGIHLAVSHEVCGEIDAFHVGGLPVENDCPFNMLEFIVVHKPVSALRHNQVEDDNQENESGCDSAQNDFLFLDFFFGG